MNNLYILQTADQLKNLILKEDIKTLFVYEQDNCKEFAKIVRCKNCDWYDIDDELCLREGMSMGEEDYCSYGKQKDE